MIHFNSYTVESVTSGHPDKICDQVSDAILDKCLEQDPQSRVAIETLGSHGQMVIAGELTTKANLDYKEIASKVYSDIGYKDKIEISTNIINQSGDISQGVDTGGAGDQGIMYGYASDETPEYMPKAVSLVHKLTKGLEDLRRNDPDFFWLGPDGKAQVTIEENNIKTVLVSCQHLDSISQSEIKEFLIKKLIEPLAGKDIEILINPTGKFIRGGFEADTGLTGRKIMVDTYGGIIPHGGGCFSGKDPTKVDRSAAYMARFVAKNIVANKLAKKCLVYVAYAIGQDKPLMLEAIDENNKNLSYIIQEKFDFRPLAIIEKLDLRKPVYFQTASYGHFGRQGFSWEEIINI